MEGCFLKYKKGDKQLQGATGVEVYVLWEDGLIACYWPGCAVQTKSLLSSTYCFMQQELNRLTGCCLPFSFELSWAGGAARVARTFYDKVE